MNFVRWYTRMLKENPYSTKSITSFFTFGLGDFICQSVESKFKPNTITDKIIEKKPYNWKRILKQGIFGVIMTPYLHVQYNILIPKFFPNPGALNTAKLLFYDQTVNASVFLIAFFTYMDLLNDVDLGTSLKNTYVKFFPTLVANWKVWPGVQLINFTFVPPEYRVLFVNVVAIGWNTYLSYVQNVKSFDTGSVTVQVDLNKKL